ncbi:MAG TPA: hypothetical protein PKA13_19035 [Geminicoccaceae bacterium]|nr:hypothetical protein [Geminicoccus sp.]HMU51878.1 hypothetical protein [Geminicoccaceae bacterium]
MRHVAITACVLLSALVSPAVADPVSNPPVAGAGAEEDVGFRGCGSHGAVARWLAGQFAETPMARGVQGDGRLFEIYMARQGSTWTVVVTDPAGESCIVTEGTSFELLPLEVNGPVA